MTIKYLKNHGVRLLKNFSHTLNHNVNSFPLLKNNVNIYF